MANPREIERLALRRADKRRRVVLVRRALIAVLFADAVALGADPVQPKSPGLICEDVSVHEVKPADLEWTYWMLGGATFEGPHGSASALGGIGAELTRQVLRYQGFPAGRSGWLATAEMRAGPWFAASTRSAGGLVEGGIVFTWDGVFSPAWGTWDLRLGAGYGAFTPGREPLVSATLLWGVRSVRARYSHHRRCLPAEPPARFAEASVIRVFVETRAGTRDADARELVVGLELSPSMLLPPYSWFRFAGYEP